MKTLLSALLLFCLSLTSRSQNIQTISFKVSGNCDECKNRIENAADIKGVKLCVWDKSTQTAKVTYNADKVTPEQIKKAIAVAGHDVEGEKSTDAAYKKLPACCRYREGDAKSH